MEHDNYRKLIRNKRLEHEALEAAFYTGWIMGQPDGSTIDGEVVAVAFAKYMRSREYYETQHRGLVHTSSETDGSGAIRTEPRICKSCGQEMTSPMDGRLLPEATDEGSLRAGGKFGPVCFSCYDAWWHQVRLLKDAGL